jgi:hypothetical protein
VARKGGERMGICTDSVFDEANLSNNDSSFD